jgi:hypothetical protein
MKFLWLVLVVAANSALADSDEALIEQLVHRPVVAAKKTEQRPSKTDPALALVGQSVRVRTVDHGLYVGTLAAVDASAIHLNIVTSGETLAYALPRSAIAALDAVGAP